MRLFIQQLSIIVWFACVSLCNGAGFKPLYWDDKPAVKWEEAVPIGNGRMGAMVFGGIQSERLQLNENTIWAGPPTPQPVENGAAALQEARQLFFEGKYTEGERLVRTRLLPRPIEPRSYQPLGDIFVTMGHSEKATDYRRLLDLGDGVARVAYTVDGVGYVREVFVSRADDVVCMRIYTDRPGKVDCRVALKREFGVTEVDRDGKTLVLRGQAANGETQKGVKFAAKLRVWATGGGIATEGSALRISGADDVMLILACATDYNHSEPGQPLRTELAARCEEHLKKAFRRWEKLRNRSVEAHKELFSRVTLDIGEGPDLPTPRRLEAVRHGTNDVALAALYFQFGRYLLISSSRPGGLPANLQGLWNEHMQAPWNSDYHININLQMNYWPAEVANLSECHSPLFDFVERLRPAGRKAASAFGCSGFCANLTTDPWLWTTPYGDPRWGMWMMGGAWCAQHFMEHYRFTQDREFLKKRTFPMLREASLFFLDWLVKDPRTGKLVSGPSTSPENGFIGPDGKTVTLSMGCSMDQEIIWDTFSNLLESAAVLGVEDDLTRRVSAAREALALPRVGTDGRLMEWAEEWKEPEPGHRHVSHLFAVHPGRQFNWRNSPEMMLAAKRSLEHRLANGGGHTGWSRAWIINFWARFRDGDKAGENVMALLAKSTLPNLFDTHPPFQIDGNFGGCAGIAEMLLQSHAGEIELLPALPASWSSGSVRGLKARGNITVDVEWRNGKVEAFHLRSPKPQVVRVRIGETVSEVKTTRK